MAVISFSSTKQVVALLVSAQPSELDPSAEHAAKAATLEQSPAPEQLSAQRSEQQLFAERAATSPALEQAFAERAATPVCIMMAPSAQRLGQQLFAERTATSAALEQLLSVQHSEPEFYAEYAAAYKEEAPSIVQGGTLKTRYKGWLFKCHAVTSL